MIIPFERTLENSLKKLQGPMTSCSAKIKLLEHFGRIIDQFQPSLASEKATPVLVGLLRGTCQTQAKDEPDQQKLRKIILRIWHELCISSIQFKPPGYDPRVVIDLVSLSENFDDDDTLTFMRITTKVVQHQQQAGMKFDFRMITEAFKRLESVVTEHANHLERVGENLLNTNNAATSVQEATGLPFTVFSQCLITVRTIAPIDERTTFKGSKAFLEPLLRWLTAAQGLAQANKGTDSDTKNGHELGEFFTAQVNATRFLAYLLKEFRGDTDSQQLKNFFQIFPDIVIRLLGECPKHKPEHREEIICATRSVINFNIRLSFLQRIDELLDEYILIGGPPTDDENIMLAYSMVADLLHHLRDDLKPETIHKAIKVFAKNLQISSHGHSFQMLSSNVLSKLAKDVTRIPNEDTRWHCWYSILSAIRNVFAAFNQAARNQTPAEGGHYPMADSTTISSALVSHGSLTSEGMRWIECLINCLDNTLDHAKISDLSNLTAGNAALSQHAGGQVFGKLLVELSAILKLLESNGRQTEQQLRTFSRLLQSTEPLQEHAPLRETCRELSEQAHLKGAFAVMDLHQWWLRETSTSGVSHQTYANDDEVTKPQAASRITSIIHDFLNDDERSQCVDEVRRICNRYPEEFWKAFRDNVGSSCRFLTSVICDDKGGLITCGRGQIGNLITDGCNMSSQIGNTEVFTIINITEAIDKLISPTWNLTPDHMKALVTMCEQLQCRPRSNSSSYLDVGIKLATEQLLDIFKKSLMESTEGVDALLMIITSKLTNPLNYLYNLLHDRIIHNWSSHSLNTIIIRCLDLYASAATEQETKVVLLQAVMSILEADIHRNWQQGHTDTGASLINETFIDLIKSHIWNHPIESALQPPMSRVPLVALQLSILIVKHCGIPLQHVFEDIISFARCDLQQEVDTLNPWARNLAAACIAKQDAPSSFAEQIYKDSLKDGRSMEAAASLAPVLSRQSEDLPGTVLGGVLARRLATVKDPRKLISFSIDHKELLYPALEKITTPLFNCLYNVSELSWLSITSVSMNIDVICFIWECFEKGSWKTKSIPDFRRKELVNLVVRFLIKMPSKMKQDSTGDFVLRAIKLLTDMIERQYWNSSGFELPDMIEETLTSGEAQAVLTADDDVYKGEYIEKIRNAIQVLDIICTSMPNNRRSEYTVRVRKLLDPWRTSKCQQIREQIRVAEQGWPLPTAPKTRISVRSSATTAHEVELPATAEIEYLTLVQEKPAAHHPKFRGFKAVVILKVVVVYIRNRIRSWTKTAKSDAKAQGKVYETTDISEKAPAIN